MDGNRVLRSAKARRAYRVVILKLVHSLKLLILTSEVVVDGNQKDCKSMELMRYAHYLWHDCEDSIGCLPKRCEKSCRVVMTLAHSINPDDTG